MSLDPSCRAFISGCCGTAAAVVATVVTSTRAHASPVKHTELSADQALALLKEGNERFVTASSECFEELAQRRQTIAAGQAPFAVVVACSDSRVPPELLFARGRTVRHP